MSVDLCRLRNSNFVHTDYVVAIGGRMLDTNLCAVEANDVGK